MSDLSTIIPVTALVAITLFGIKEFLEWRRRAAADTRKLQAIKKVLARDIEFNHRSIVDLSEILTEIKDAPVRDLASVLSITPDPSGGFVVIFLENGYLQKGLRRENLVKHLVDIAALDESFYEHCNTVLDGVSAANHVLRSLVNGPDKHFPSTPHNFYRGLAEYGVDELARSREIIKNFYTLCTGSELPKARHLWDL